MMIKKRGHKTPLRHEEKEKKKKNNQTKICNVITYHLYIENIIMMIS